MNTVYLLSDPRNLAPRYVGIAINLKKRLQQHCSGRGRAHCRSWVRSLLQVGLEPAVSILEVVPDHQREDAERAWILGFRQAGSDLTNLTDGGEGTLGRKASSETKSKMREAAKGHIASPETRAKVSAALIGNKHLLGHVHTEESRAKIGAALKGRIISEKSRAKIRAALIGHTTTAKARSLMSAAGVGRTHVVTSAARTLIRTALTGRHVSAETREKLRAAWRRRKRR